MDGLSLPTAQAFSGMVSFLICIFCLALSGARRSERTAKTYTFLAIAYGLQGLRRAWVFMTHWAPFMGLVVDPLYILWTFSLWVGVRSYGRKTAVPPAWLAVPAVLIGWSLIAHGLDVPRIWRLLPMHFAGAALYWWAGIHLWRLNHEHWSWGLAVLPILFLLSGLNTAIAPFAAHTWYGPYGFALASGMNLTIGMGLMLTALLEEQQALVDETKSRRLAEEASRRSFILIETLLASSPAGIAIYEGNTGRCVIANQAMADMTGGSIDALRSQNFRTLDSWRLAGLTALTESALSDNVTQHQEVSVCTSFGKDVALEFFISRFDVEGKPHLMLIATDITHRKQAQEALLRKTALLEAQMNASLDGIMVTDEHGTRLLVNQRMIDMGDVPQHILVGGNARAMQDYLTELVRNPGEFMEKVRYLSGHPYATSRDEVEFKSGKILDRYSAPVLGEDGHYYGRIWTFRDITERKRAEEEKARLEFQLLQSQKMEAVGTLAGGVAHDFNNILTTIIGYSSLLQGETDNGDPRKLYVDHILTASQKAAGLTQSLLAFSRKQAIELKPCKVNHIIKEMEKLLIRLLTEDITLNVVLAGPDATIMADITQMDQVLINLAANARDAMPGGGSLVIEAKEVHLDDEFVRIHGYGEPGSYAVITVTDTGCGMDEKIRQKVFEPFFTTKEAGKGTGLGLSTVYGIIKQHNGFINVYSEPGKGTAFRIYIPTIKAESTEIALDPQPIRGGTETILVAEDNSELRGLMKRVLLSHGYVVIEAVDGEDAVQQFTAHKDSVRLLVLDVVMPRKNGKDAYEEIRRMRPDVKALFASGYTGDVVLGKGIQDDAPDFVSKPLSPKELLIKVREILDR